MSITWTLVCDPSRACLYGEGHDGSLRLLGIRENPMRGRDQLDTISVAHSRERFARELALLLQRGVADGQCNRIVLVAPPTMLEGIRLHLTHRAMACTIESCPVDLGESTGVDIEATLFEVGADT